MRYQVDIALAYLATGNAAVEIIRPLTEGIRTALSEHAADCRIAELEVRADSAAVITVRAVLHGSDARHLTSPLAALTTVDAAVGRALMKIGLFEVFDMARRTLHVRAADR
ncbi:hypothetical protein Val02_73170 [Virgisporangium aliadipatigenens]|uniref:Uncharacterized protein n=1 Tax=Virgisporangium aliadipatigenens TaxID=741659 RepID=A0A8J3YS16_9ACTN|nr:hypothetical protein [Virgisporangium aliadipatigenens]GIJ50431.1 hypothetical protein Val02_73170 [Virgisporangium aliadipatigenens]